MATLDPASRKLAKRLARLSAEAGDDAPAQIKPALDRLIGDRPLSERRAFVKAYLLYLDRAIRERQLVIEHAGPISDTMIREVASAFATNTGRRFSTVTRENPELIGGLRLIQGDNVYDASLAGRLDRLASSIH